MYLLFVFWTVLQMICAPVQGTLSDLYCRRKGLLIAVAGVLVSCLFILSGLLLCEDPKKEIWVFVVGIAIDAVFGNSNTIGRAALIDSRFAGDARKALGYSFMAQGLPWVVVFAYCWFLPDLYMFMVVLNLLCLILCFFYFEDKRDEDPLREQRLFWARMKKLFSLFYSPTFRWAIIAFLISQIGFEYFFFHEDHHISLRVSRFVFTLLGFGYFSGAFLQNFIEVQTQNLRKVVLAGFWISIFGFAIIPVFFHMGCNFFGNPQEILEGVAALLMMAAGFYFPSLYTLFSKGRPIHEQGKLFGFLESIQNLSEVIPPLLVLLWVPTDLHVIYICATLYLIGLIIFNRFVKPEGKFL